MFLHSVAVPNQAPGADAVVSHDLAVNPLSVILICLRPLNDTGTLANFASYLSVCDAINRLTVLYRGESIVQMSGRDAAAMAFFRYGIAPFQNTHLISNNDRRCVVLPVVLGQFPYDKSSCFPATRRGELVLEMDLDIADTGYDDLNYTIETIEILDAKPREYERKVTTTQTFAATGDNDIDFPTGNMFRGILAFGTTAFTGTAPAPTLGRMSTLLDNSQMGYSSTDFEVAFMLPSLWGRVPPGYDEHVHRENTAASYAQNALTAGPSSVMAGGWQNYVYLDFDPTRNDEHSINTKGKSRFSLRADSETANLVRAIPVEVIKV